jgi:menaquinol-cytochrome c reductase iron-sulfur subunit
MPSEADRDRMVADLREAVRSLDEALADFPKEAASKLSPAEAALARVRDALIARHRVADDPATASAVRGALDRANLCLSLVLGVEYPQGSAKKQPLEQARGVINELAGAVESLPANGPPDPLPATEPVEPPLPPERVSPSVGIPERIRSAVEAERTVSRRTALNVLIGIGAGTAAAVVGVPVLATGLSPAFGLRGENWQSVGRQDDFPVGGVVAARVPVPRDDGARGLRAKAVYVWRVSRDETIVYSRNCTDASCPVVYDAGSDCFLCPCHGGIFLKDGTPIHGPPSQPLWRYASRVRGGVLEIDLNSLPPMT